MITIVDYKAGNLTSVRLALEYIGVPAHITRDPDRIRRAERIIFPGVGSAGAAMRHIGDLALGPALRESITRGIPFLGICLGTQIIFERSEEDGNTSCLGCLPGVVQKFRPVDPADKVPQIGWNSVRLTRPHPLFAGIENGSEFYFVHSYYPIPAEPECVLGESDYAGVRFAAIVGRANLFATQFHPEKSGRIGLRLLQNFAEWSGGWTV